MADVPSVPASKRGRKRNDNLPPNRARDVQRAFRARRAAHLQDLESRVEILETENYRLRQMLSLPPSDRQPLGRGPTGRDPGKLMPKVGEVPLHPGPPDHYSDRSTPSPSGSHHGYAPQSWHPSGDHYALTEDPISRTPSSGSNSPYPHAVNYDYASQRLPSMHSRDGLMMPGTGSPSFNGASTPRDEGLLGFGSNGFASPAPNGVNNHPSAALPPHSHSNANLLVNPVPAGSNRIIPNFLSGSGPNSSYAPRRSVNDLGSNHPSFPPRSASMGGGIGLNGPSYGSGAPGGRLGLSSPSPIN
ncbi:hypothetical protein B0J17DRAFT_647877 [Rhizoctonia solani]|nr:hypothetical protein B0J17DRAFT_647877 [Rhizoctonia solani]